MLMGLKPRPERGARMATGDLQDRRRVSAGVPAPIDTGVGTADEVLYSIPIPVEHPDDGANAQVQICATGFDVGSGSIRLVPGQSRCS